METLPTVLHNTVATPYMWQCNTWNVASADEELNFLFYLIVTKFKLPQEAGLLDWTMQMQTLLSSLFFLLLLVNIKSTFLVEVHCSLFFRQFF